MRGRRPGGRRTGPIAGVLLAACLLVAARPGWLVPEPLTAAAPADQDQPPVSRQPFEAWLADLREEAIALGIREQTVDAALATIEAPSEEVIARDRDQPERIRTLEDYISGWLSPRTVSTARTLASRHADLLRKVTAAYGLPGPVMVAVWGLESNFGRFTGTEPTVAALATLAYDPRRSALFRTELLEALRILDAGHVTLDEMTGSWAGAMGQPQFMPSSYLKFAVDFDGDGRADIWRSEADVFASMANYLRDAGWVEGERWGREVQISREVLARIDAEVPRRRSGCGAIRQLTVGRPLPEWQALGVRLAGGAALPASNMTASLVRGDRRYFLVYRNYLALLSYNCSNSYAVSIGLLSDRLW